MTIEEAYVSFEIAKLLKEKGFPQEYDIYHSMVYNEEDYEDEYEVQRMVLETKLVKAGTLSSYPVGVPEPKCYCPTQQIAMRWLREVYCIIIIIIPSIIQSDSLEWITSIRTYNKEEHYLEEQGIVGRYNSYEEACESAIKYCLEYLI